MSLLRQPLKDETGVPMLHWDACSLYMAGSVCEKSASSCIQSATSCRDAPPAKRCLSSQLACGAKGCSSSALEPMPLEPEVQNGTIVTPSSSQPSKKVQITLGALPHHIACPN